MRARVKQHLLAWLLLGCVSSTQLRTAWAKPRLAQSESVVAALDALRVLSFFIIGTERSGSNKLQTMLGQLAEISVPHPPHIMELLYRLEPRYGDLRQDENFRRLIRHVIGLVDRHTRPWGIEINEELVFETAHRSLLGIYLNVHQQYAYLDNQSPHFLCKSTFMIHHVEELLALNPGFKFVWLVRDPRDVALSAKTSEFMPFAARLSAARWAHEQQIGLELLKKYGPETIHMVKYEDYTDPDKSEGVFRGITDFLGVPFDPSIFDAHHGSEARGRAKNSHSWKNLEQPLKRNSGQFRTGLTHQEIADVEEVAGKLMDRLGYARMTWVRSRTHYEQRADDQWAIEQNAELKRDFESARVQPANRPLIEAKSRYVANLWKQTASEHYPERGPMSDGFHLFRIQNAPVKALIRMIEEDPVLTASIAWQVEDALLLEAIVGKQAAGTAGLREVLSRRALQKRGQGSEVAGQLLSGDLSRVLRYTSATIRHWDGKSYAAQLRPPRLP